MTASPLFPSVPDSVSALPPMAAAPHVSGVNSERWALVEHIVAQARSATVPLELEIKIICRVCHPICSTRVKLQVL